MNDIESLTKHLERVLDTDYPARVNTRTGQVAPMRFPIPFRLAIVLKIACLWPADGATVVRRSWFGDDWGVECNEASTRQLASSIESIRAATTDLAFKGSCAKCLARMERWLDEVAIIRHQMEREGKN
jgi:hypothetical protein